MMLLNSVYDPNFRYILQPASYSSLRMFLWEEQRHKALIIHSEAGMVVRL